MGTSGWKGKRMKRKQKKTWQTRDHRKQMRKRTKRARGNENTQTAIDKERGREGGRERTKKKNYVLIFGQLRPKTPHKKLNRKEAAKRKHQPRQKWCYFSRTVLPRARLLRYSGGKCGAGLVANTKKSKKSTGNGRGAKGSKDKKRRGSRPRPARVCQRACESNGTQGGGRVWTVCSGFVCENGKQNKKKKHKPTLRAQLGAAKERRIVRRSTPWMKRVKKSPRTVNKRTHACVCVCVCKWGRRVQPGASYGVVKRDKRKSGKKKQTDGSVWIRVRNVWCAGGKEQKRADGKGGWVIETKRVSLAKKSILLCVSECVFVCI